MDGKQTEQQNEKKNNRKEAETLLDGTNLNQKKFDFFSHNEKKMDKISRITQTIVCVSRSSKTQFAPTIAVQLYRDLEKIFWEKS